jgi:hypothetical protein
MESRLGVGLKDEELDVPAEGQKIVVRIGRSCNIMAER